MLHKPSLEYAVKELYFWQHSPGATNFHAQLYTLFQIDLFSGSALIPKPA